MGCLGIIPSAGLGTRWGGYIKELLPTGPNRFLLTDCMNTLIEGGADKICLITNPDKVSIVSRHLSLHAPDIDVMFIIDSEPRSMWGSMVMALPFCDSENLFMMPDTVIHPASFKSRKENSNLQFGVFKTKSPERFSVFDNGVIVCKNKDYIGREMNAWGTIAWKSCVTDFWLENLNEIEDYDHAFNMAMVHFGCDVFHLSYYHDLASWNDYSKYLQLK